MGFQHGWVFRFGFHFKPHNYHLPLIIKIIIIKKNTHTMSQEIDPKREDTASYLAKKRTEVGDVPLKP